MRRIFNHKTYTHIQNSIKHIAWRFNVSMHKDIGYRTISIQKVFLSAPWTKWALKTIGNSTERTIIGNVAFKPTERGPWIVSVSILHMNLKYDLRRIFRTPLISKAEFIIHKNLLLLADLVKYLVNLFLLL